MMNMKLRTKLILLMGGMALLVLAGILGVSLVHLKHTTDSVQELGKTYSLRLLTKRAQYTVEMFRHIIESDYHRLAQAPLPDNCSPADMKAEDLPARIDAIAFAPAVPRGKETAEKHTVPSVVNGLIKSSDGTIRPMTPGEIAALDKVSRKVHSDPDHHKKHQHGESHFLMLAGDLWAHCSRGRCWFFLRFNKSAMEEYILNNTMTHFVLLDENGKQVLSTLGSGDSDDALPILTHPDMEKLSRTAMRAENKVFTLALNRWLCVAVKLDFPEFGLRNALLLRIYDVPTMVPEVVAGIDHSLNRFYIFHFLLLAVAGGLLMLALILFARRIAAPLTKAAEFADTLAGGDFPQPLPPEHSGVSETARLYVALNRMRDRLFATFEKLRRSHLREQHARQDAESASGQKTEFIYALADNLRELIRKVPADQTQLAAGLTQCENLLRDLAELDSDKEPVPEVIDVFAFFRSEIMPFTRNLDVRYASDIPELIRTDRELFHNLIARTLQAVVKHSSGRIRFTVDLDHAGTERLCISLEGSGSNRALLDYLQCRTGNWHISGTETAEDVILLNLAFRTARKLGGEFEVQYRDDGSYTIRISFFREDLAVD